MRVEVHVFAMRCYSFVEYASRRDSYKASDDEDAEDNEDVTDDWSSSDNDIIDVAPLAEVATVAAAGSSETVDLDDVTFQLPPIEVQPIVATRGSGTGTAAAATAKPPRPLRRRTLSASRQRGH